MKRDMRKWVRDMIAAEKKQALPILSFPGVQLLGKTVKEVINDSALYAEGLCKVSGRPLLALPAYCCETGNLYL